MAEELSGQTKEETGLFVESKKVERLVHHVLPIGAMKPTGSVAPRSYPECCVDLEATES
jgi:hypothetical protein